MKIKVWSPERGLRRLKDGVSLTQYQEKVPTAIKVHIPCLKKLSLESNDGSCRSVDGCRVEPDGTCSHGYPSWLIVLGYI